MDDYYPEQTCPSCGSEDVWQEGDGTDFGCRFCREQWSLTPEELAGGGVDQMPVSEVSHEEWDAAVAALENLIASNLRLEGWRGRNVDELIESCRSGERNREAWEEIAQFLAESEGADQSKAGD